MGYSDIGLRTNIAIIKNNDRHGENLSDFELAAAILLPYDPVAKRKLSKGHDEKYDSVAKITAASLSKSASEKPSTGNTGVCIKWNDPGEFHKLSKD